MIVVYGLAIFGAYCLALWTSWQIRVARGDVPTAPEEKPSKLTKQLRDRLKWSVDVIHELQRNLVDAHGRRMAAEAALQHLLKCPGCAGKLLELQREASEAGRELLPPH